MHSLRFPAGLYLRSAADGVAHSKLGHMTYLLGMRSEKGWWYYYPVLVAHKIPIGIYIIILFSLFSLKNRPISGAEWAVVVAWAAWTALLVRSNINIGFRHYLPAYVFLIMLASRCLVAPGRFGPAIAWGGVLAAGLHGTWQHPNYLSYINAPWPHPYLAISDSNIDWGQSMKQVGRWLDENPRPGKKVFLAYFGSDQGGISHYIKGRAIILRKRELPEPRSVLIISPIQLVGAYGDDRFEALRSIEPDDIIGNAMLVYDLDRFGDKLPFQAPPPGAGDVLQKE